MTIPSSRTPEGRHQRCPTCGHDVVIEASSPTWDAPCPHCGHLLWFDPVNDILCRFDISPVKPKPKKKLSNKLAGESYRKGSEAMSGENWSFAVEMFSQNVAFVPDNLMYRRVLRGGEYKLYDDNGSGAYFCGLPLVPILKSIKRAKSQEDWDKVDRLAEQGLRWNPWHTELNFDLGLASLARGYREVALFAFECAFRSSPGREDIRKIIADLRAI